MTFGRHFLIVLIAISVLAGPPVVAAQGLENMFRDAIGKLLPQGDDTQSAGRKEEETDKTVRVPASRAEMQLSFAPVVRKVADSVVNVYGSRKRSEFRSPFAGDPFFERFFGKPKRRGGSSLGSGVIVGDNGTILTNNHVIENMDSVKIAFADGREFECEIVLKDKKSDLAVLKAKGDVEFKPIEIGDSDSVQVGDLVLAIGNPFGVGQTVTGGIVSAVSRSLAGINDYGFFIQTDAAINPGNSGGALVDMKGRLIGVNTMIYSKGGGSIGIGYAVPSNMAKVVLRSARTGDRVNRPWIGAWFGNVTPEIAESLEMSRPAGALVVGVTHNSPAEKAGLKPGDIVLSINGRKVDHPETLGYRLDTIGIGNDAELEILSRSIRKRINMALLAPPETVPRDIRRLPENSQLAGAVVANLSPALAQEAGINRAVEGVVVLAVSRDSPAGYNGIAKGDIIRSVNGTKVESTQQLELLVQRRARGWQLVVERNGQFHVYEREGPFLRHYRQ